MAIDPFKSAKNLLGSVLCFLFLVQVSSFLREGCFGQRAYVPSDSIKEISPNTPNPDMPRDKGAGGRVNHIGASPDGKTYYAASEWGGLFKSIDSGATWKHLDNHLPTATWDVKVSPIKPNTIYATSFYDGRVKSLAGINVSFDSGETWIHPTDAIPSVDSCGDPVQRDELSAFDIATEMQNVYIGTNCGLAISNDNGHTWHYADPTPEDKAHRIWGVTAHHNGIIDTCGFDGHRRSMDGGNKWNQKAKSPLMSGVCSIAASPDESYVLFAVVGAADNAETEDKIEAETKIEKDKIFETNDGGDTWIAQFDNPAPYGRIPFVRTNKRSWNRFDLWFGDKMLYRANCVTPQDAKPGGDSRCPGANPWTGENSGGHADAGEIIFDPRNKIDACPILFSNDGGVYFNEKKSDAACHDPQWKTPDIAPHALRVLSMNGIPHPEPDLGELYAGVMDNGFFATITAGSDRPVWQQRSPFDGQDSSTDGKSEIYTICCLYNPATRIHMFDAGNLVLFDDEIEFEQYPPGDLIRSREIDIIDNFGPNRFVAITDKGVHVTDNIKASQVEWTRLGNNSPPRPCGIHAVTKNNETTFYVQAGDCTGSSNDTLWRYRGTEKEGRWEEILPRRGIGAIGIFGVDPLDPNVLIISRINGLTASMFSSKDGGKTWHAMKRLDRLMTANGVFKPVNSRGPSATTHFQGYAQPSMLAFDPGDTKTIVVGGADSGLFITTDRGRRWKAIVDNSQARNTVRIPRPRFAFFDRKKDYTNLYIGTQGRGVWRMKLYRTGKRVRPRVQK
jgi:photosystem II stability/assembly factor-like uncharacterized protein